MEPVASLSALSGWKQIWGEKKIYEFLQDLAFKNFDILTFKLWFTRAYINHLLKLLLMLAQPHILTYTHNQCFKQILKTRMLDALEVVKTFKGRWYGKYR